MPPRRKAAAKAASPPAAVLPLSGCKIALCGVFPKLSQTVLRDHIEELGGTPLDSVTSDATQLIVTPANYKRPTAKVTAAKKLDIPIVNVQWLLDCVSADAMQSETNYLLDKPATPAAAPASPPAPAPAPAPAVAAPPAATKGRKRAAPAAAAAVNGTNGAAAAPPSPPAAPPAPAAKRQKKDTKASAKAAAAAPAAAAATSTSKLDVPVDECCPMPNVSVYIADDGTVWDASLNQTNSGNNNNKFYRIQILTTGAGKYHTWTRWGRVGERGQSAMLGGGSLDDAEKNFNKKFRDKSGLAWERRSDDPRPGKYAYVERNYQPDSDDEDGDEDEDDARGEFKKEEEEGETKIPECTLAPPVQSLMELIFNRQYFANTMSDLNYDANKLPLGKLSKTTITRGFQALKNLAALMDDNSLAMSEYHMPYPHAVESLSNLYYSVIPHAFGRNRPPIISDNTRLKKEIELLESLSDMKDAELLMKVDKARTAEDRSIHPADKQYQNLGMEEVTPLDHKSAEFAELSNYLNSTTGQTHHVNYKVQDIFRIERRGEKDRFDACNLGSPAAKDNDTRLLWHGSRVTNFGGILGQGLRIAPPEAPVSGYMFGKGIYLADMSSKSAGYCASGISNGTGLLLLCEAKLGDPMQKLTHASYTAGDDAKAKGLYATLGQGRTAPPAWKDASAVHKDLAGVQMPDVSSPPTDTNVQNAGLYYNEYIVYDVNQVRLRYLFRVKM